VTQNAFPPNAIIEEVWVENHPRALTDTIVLQPNETKIEFRYTGINFTSPKKIRFQYVLDRFEKEWNEGVTNRLARYTNLDPGTYQFRVRAENNAGMPGEHEASIHILVLPPFYETWWFRSMIIILFLTVGPVIYVLRVRQLTAEKEKQMEFSRRLIASQESERKRIASELHDSLGQNLLIIKNKLLVALQTMSREIPTTAQVEDASTIVSNTIEEVRSISHNLRPHQLDQLGITKTLRSIVRQVNESTAIEFSAEIQDIDGTMSPEEEISLFRIIQESFNNIIKHSGASKVIVKILRTEELITVTIADDGKGASAPSGFGISGMQERAKMFGWQMLIESKQGTEITIHISIHTS
jgi:signal transduction histidine kinase